MITASTDQLRKFFCLTHFNENKLYSYLEKQSIYLSHLLHACTILTFELFSSCAKLYSESKTKQYYLENTSQITIPLAICQASEKSCLVEKPSSSSSSSDSCRLSFESDITEAWRCPGDADVLGSSSLSVSLNCLSYNEILFKTETAELWSY